MPKYQKKPVVIEAVILKYRTEIKTLEGTRVGEPGDYLITGVKGEQYFCKPAIFEKTYTLVSEDTPTTFQLAMQQIRENGRVSVAEASLKESGEPPAAIRNQVGHCPT